MRILVNIDQKASIAAGYEAPSSTEIIDIPVADIPEETRKIIAAGYDVKSGAVNVYNGLGNRFDTSIAAPVTAGVVIEMLNRIARAKAWSDLDQAKKRAQEDALNEERRTAARAVDQQAADYIDALPDFRSTYPSPLEEAFKSLGILTGYTRDTTPLAYAALDRMAARYNAYAKDKAAREKKAGDDRVIAKREFLADWIAKNAEASVAQQQKDGLLSESHAVNLVRKATFGAIGLDDDYKPHVCHIRDCPCSDDYTETLPPDVYEAWLQIKATLPKDASVRFSKVRVCTRDEEYADADADTEPEIIYDAEIAIQAGPFELKRRVRL